MPLRDHFQLFRPLVSSWEVYDNTQAGLPRLVAHGDETGREIILLDVAWQQMQKEALP